MNHPAQILLSALFVGQELEFQLSPDIKLTFAIVETEDKGWQLCYIMHRMDTQKPEEKWEKEYYISDLSVNQLLRYSCTLSDEQLFLISSRTAMIKMGKERFSTQGTAMEKRSDGC